MSTTHALATRPVGTLPDSPVIDRFEAEVGSLWPHVAPFVVEPADEELPELIDSTRRRGDDADDLTRDLAHDLEALLAGWAHYDATERAVLRGAVTYLTEADDAFPDDGPHGYADEEVVVEAAVKALLRGD